MVRVFPVRSVMSNNPSASLQASPSSKVVNRFKSKFFDRSVSFGDECVSGSGPCSCCYCNPSPVVVVSPNGENICSSHLVSLRNVKELSDGGLLEKIAEETFMIYAQVTPNGTQIGILAGLDVEDCKNNLVKRHELCIPEHDKPVPQRVKQYQSLYVDPIMIMYRQNATIDDVINHICSTESPIEVTTNDSNQQHLLWCVRDKDHIVEIQKAFENIDALYIADGHHRTAAACRSYQAPSSSSVTVQGSPRVQRKGTQSFNSSRYITALLYPDTQLNVLSFNRCIKSFGKGISVRQFIDEAEREFVIQELSEEDVVDIEFAQKQNDSAGECILMYTDHTWYKMILREKVDTDFITGDECSGNPDEGVCNGIDGSSSTPHLLDIDAQVLVDKLFKPIIKLQYPESEKNMIYIDGRKGRAEVKNTVDSGEAVAGFVVRKVSTRMIMNLADANHLLPPKATFFDPKPMAGLMIRLKR